VNVRDATFEVLRHFELTTIFGNPGSTEVPFLVDLPEDIRFVLALHEGSVVGMASGYAIARGKPSLVNLHTAAGLGNAINAIANARDIRAPLVVLVGQQDRRQLAAEPFLTGRALERLAGENPVWTSVPVRAQDVPGVIARAYHEAEANRGPALVVVPMGDWFEPADELAVGGPRHVIRPGSIREDDLEALAALIAHANEPAIVVGAGTDSREAWDALVALADRLKAPVWHEAFAPRVGFPQDHPLFAGHLPWLRAQVRDKLAPHDLVLAIGASALRLYLFDEAVAVVSPGARVAVITEDSAEAHRSSCEIAVVGPVAGVCAALAQRVPDRADAHAPPPRRRLPAPAPPVDGRPLGASHVLAALAQRLPPDAVVVEETPSSRPELLERITARTPLGFLSNGNGCLGFGFPGAIGLRMGLPDRPVVGVIGDGSAMYAIQALWSAARYEAGVLLIVMANGGYAIMDELARVQGGRGAWPSFGAIDIAAIARALGCQAIRVDTHDQLAAMLDEVMPGLRERREPLVVEVAVA